MVVKKVEALDQGNRWLAEVNFLFDEAPHVALREGREFEIYEGWKCVARGKLVGEAELAERLESEALGPRAV